MTTTFLNKVMNLDLARNIAQLLGSEQLNDQENIEAHEILMTWASSMNQVLHITDGGAVYLATSHDLRESSDTTRLN
jgi:hypothetical protein